MAYPYGRSPYAEPQQPAFAPDLLGPLEVVTPPSGYVVTTAQAKTQCRIVPGVGDDDDAINDLILDAQDYCEKLVPGHRQFLAATYKAPCADFWSWDKPLYLPRPPLQSVGSVKYYDTSGTLTTLSSSLYVVRTPWRAPGSITRAPYQTWPAVQPDRRYPVEVTFTCGYTTVPRTVQRAVLLLVGWWYVHRDEVPDDKLMGAVEALLATEGFGYR
jgi:uncharacterized phiE125 gp8 family phage protein